MAGQPIVGDFGIEHPIRVVPPKTRGTSRVWYKPNHRSFGAFIRSDQMRDVTEEVADDIALEATGEAPPPTAETIERAEEQEDGSADPVVYKVKRNAGLVMVSGNRRVNVEIFAKGANAERAEFGHRGDVRFRTLARAGSRFGDWHPIDEWR